MVVVVDSVEAEADSVEVADSKVGSKCSCKTENAQRNCWAFFFD